MTQYITPPPTNRLSHHCSLYAVGAALYTAVVFFRDSPPTAFHELSDASETPCDTKLQNLVSSSLFGPFVRSGARERERDTKRNEQMAIKQLFAEGSLSIE